MRPAGRFGVRRVGSAFPLIRLGAWDGRVLWDVQYAQVPKMQCIATIFIAILFSIDNPRLLSTMYRVWQVVSGSMAAGGAKAIADCGPAVAPASAWLRLGKSLWRDNSATWRAEARRRRVRNSMTRSTKLQYLMIPTRQSGFIAPLFGFFEENRCNRLSMNILHKNGRLFNEACSRSIKVNKGQ